jgi:hypothetical protein
LSLDKGTPGVQELPAEHVDGTWKGTESKHSGWNGEDTGCEDDCPRWFSVMDCW